MGRSIIAVFLLAVCTTGSMFGDQDCSTCDCTHWPWKDECNKCCTLKVLQKVPPDDLKTMLKLDDKSIGKIVNKRTTGQLTSVQDLSEILSEPQLRSINQRLSKLSPGEKDRLRKEITNTKKLNYLEQHSEGANSPNIVAGDNSPVIINNPPTNPYDARITWDYNGGQRIASGNENRLVVGDEASAFQEFVALESKGDWELLLARCNREIVKSPGYPSSYLFAAEANAKLGHLKIAKQQLEAVEKKVGSSLQYAPQIEKVRRILTDEESIPR